MKFKYIVLTMILSITSMQYAMFGMRRTAKIAPEYSTKPKAQESLYDQYLNKLQNPNHGYTKTPSILRALTGTALYEKGNGETAVLNKITGTISYRNSEGKPTLQVSKTLNGKTKEVKPRDNRMRDRKTGKILIDGNGKPFINELETGTIKTTFDTNNRKGKRTERTKSNATGETNSTNFDINGDATSTLNSYTNMENSIDRRIVDLYDPVTKNKRNQNEISYSSDSRKYTPYFNKFQKERVTGLFV